MGRVKRRKRLKGNWEKGGKGVREKVMDEIPK
jgi:hypothetical protein